ncbi:MAG: MFS transporter [Candidatus Bathyarchaeota archaeon]|nr:MAG: MFS transporter [Candidatus Bathyarchaeota archaeon]
MFYAFVAYGFVFQAVPPLIDVLTEQFSIASAAQAGLLMTIVVVPGIFLSLPAGLIADRYGFKGLGVASIALTVAGSLVAAIADSFQILLLGRLILGIGGAFLVTSLPAAIAQWFSRGELGKAMGFYGTNMPVATIASFLAASLLLLFFNDWRHTFLVGAILAGTAMVIFILFVREGPIAKSQNQEKAPFWRALRSLELWKVGLVWLLFQMAAISFLSWAPSIFHNYRGLDLVNASLLASVLMIAAIPFVPFFGWLSDRIRRRKLFLAAGPFLMALALVSSAYSAGLGLVVSVAFLGFAAAMVPSVVSALPVEILEPEAVGVGFGVMAACLNIGVSLAAPLFGYLFDVTGSLEVSFVGIAAFSVVGGMVALTLKAR